MMRGDAEKERWFLIQAMTNKPAGFLSGTDLLHADDKYHGSEVSPSISVTTSKLDSVLRLAGSDTHDIALISLQDYSWCQSG